MEKDKNKADNIKDLNAKNAQNDNSLLSILREKDNLIVSLKESSTQRDKLNEKQIMMLSEDNSRQQSFIQNLQKQVQEFESRMSKRDSELTLLRVSESKLTSKIDEFKIGFEKYKSQVRDSLNQIKLSIQDELSKREEYKNQVLDNLKDQYLKLESQIQEVDNYYKEIIAEIAKKQGVSKKYIRHALNDLQEALSLLDMSHADYIEPTHIKEEFGKMVEDSTAMFQEFREMKGLPQGSTIIKNIETVNVSLADTPAIEGVFNEIAQITKATRSGLEKSAQASLKESQATSSAGGAGASAGTAKGAKGAGAADAGAGAGTAGEASGAGTQAGKGEAKAAGSGAEDEKKKASLGELSSDRGREETPQKKKLPEDQIQEVIFRKGRNYAPFNWREILSDIQLKRFESFIESCIKAEKEGKFMKALGLYRTIKEQPGIADTIAGRLLEDHIEYLEDLIKRKYSFKYKPTVPDKKVQIT